ncbi:MAG TPA: hypothetical protein DIT39_07025 [Tissierellales bacterium]|nr:hypothetical protein [Tissierellales bacterium]
MENVIEIPVLLPMEERIAEFKWQGGTTEIFLNNYISTPQGLFLWEDLDEKVLETVIGLYNTKLLTKLETQLAA